MMTKNNAQKETGKIVAVSVSLKKGVKKTNIRSGRLVENHGLENDAHAGDWHRQVSLLAGESIDNVKEILPTLKNGAFAENIITRGLNLIGLAVGDRLVIGDKTEIEVTQIGKECHHGCA
ncbi:MAG: MOSC domain-containing protein, partial [Desulfobacterales bacterium]|nr:MOSC domain-containing protein [Desulfobacterales bacterium]